MNFIYKNFLKPFFFLFDAEFIHNSIVTIGKILGSNFLGRKLTDLMLGYHGRDISKVVDGINYRTPVLLSAGFDYNANLGQILPFVGFGGEEIGSVTAKPTVGNEPPRLTRLKKNKSILVNKGLKNDGVEVIINRLKKIQKFNDFVLGVSIAKTNEQSTGTIEGGINDYHHSLKRLVEENVGDYYTINISCPNAFSGETFGDSPELLDKLLSKLKEVKTSKPIYVKLPINKSWEETDSLVQIVLKYKMNGVVIGNLNKKREHLEFPDEVPEGRKGNLSGKPTFELSNKLIEAVHKKYGDRLTIIGVGGIFSPEDAMKKFELGADLVQLITGMIFEGPMLIKNISYKYAEQYK